MIEVLIKEFLFPLHCHPLPLLVGQLVNWKACLFCDVDSSKWVTVGHLVRCYEEITRFSRGCDSGYFT